MASESLAATAAEQFVHQIGTGTVVHNSGASVHQRWPYAGQSCTATTYRDARSAGDLFSEHLVSVQRVLESWHAGRELELAGLYHSIYGYAPAVPGQPSEGTVFDRRCSFLRA